MTPHLVNNEKKFNFYSFCCDASLYFGFLFSKNIGSGDISTTDITDINGETHYYETVTEKSSEPVTDENGSTVYAEIVTNKNEEAETDKNKNYVTKENTTIFNNTEKRYFNN